MPFKANAARRRRISRQQHRKANPAACDAALCHRNSLTVRFTEDAIAAWQAEPRVTRGGQGRYSDLAIATALTLKAVFRLALRRTKGLIGSIIALLGLDLAVPPPSSAVPSGMAGTAPTQRGRHVQLMRERGRMARQSASGYNWRALVEADVSRVERVVGDGVRSRTDRRRTTEVVIAVSVLKHMLDLGRPEYVRMV